MKNSGRAQGDINNSKNRKEYQEKYLKGEAREIYERDARVFIHQSLSTPVMNVLKGAEGAYIIDCNGKRYLDMHGNGVHNAGFNNPHIIGRLKETMDELLTFTPRRYTNIRAVELAEKLVEISPEGLDRVLFAPGGSEAIEMAVMLAKQVTGKWKTISYWDSYHGTGFQAASIGGEEHFKGGNGPMVPGAIHMEFPNYYRNPWGFEREKQVDDECLRQLRMILEREGDVACLIGEPISATPVVPSRYYWEGVRKICDEYGVLIIFDEVIEGFGRTGKMFASEHFITPDILVMGKSLGGGLVPFAGILTREEYNDKVKDRSIGHYTHEKNALCATAGLAEIEYLQSEGLIEKAYETGEWVKEELKALGKKHYSIGNISGIGYHLGIEIVKDRTAKERAEDLAEKIMYRAMEKGIAFKIIESNIITLRPSLLVTRREWEYVIRVLDECLDELTG